MRLDGAARLPIEVPSSSAANDAPSALPAVTLSVRAHRQVKNPVRALARLSGSD